MIHNQSAKSPWNVRDLPPTATNTKRVISLVRSLPSRKQQVRKRQDRFRPGSGLDDIFAGHRPNLRPKSA